MVRGFVHGVHKYMNAEECPVCLQTCIQPVRLPCNHVFCFLCVKGAANLSKRCALCRQVIPNDYLLNPELLDPHDLVPPKPAPAVTEAAAADGSGIEVHTWYYEGRGGWWQYDERTCAEIESAYLATRRRIELLIAGFLYVVDFDSMVQTRRNDPHRRRRVKRDRVGIPDRKGVAGIRLPQPEVVMTAPLLPCDAEMDTDELSSLPPSRRVQLDTDELSSLPPLRRVQLDTELAPCGLTGGECDGTGVRRDAGAPYDASSEGSSATGIDVIAGGVQAINVNTERVPVLMSSRRRRSARQRFPGSDRVRLLDCDTLSSSDEEML
ncbi:PREDICTED: E3 ubiquitin-protein ligase rnf146-like [Priapulus caudatus]|uniref:E3 ubiquitin-protein ligase n=1 Tax=Priapulus caudatus TaxID=37621 RepID=A0ABM1ELK3_PRICU|nr:PREDICTED: E3 ubiquitin-protein ligase rnf146-like [Priapulus caudatus]